MLKISLDWQGKKIECEVLDIAYPIYEKEHESWFARQKIVKYEYLEILDDYFKDEFMRKYPDNQDIKFYVKANNVLGEWFKAYQVNKNFTPLKRNIAANGKIYIENDSIGKCKDIKNAVIIEYNENIKKQNAYYILTSDY